MKHLVVGDVHGFHKNLRGFLRDQKVIDKKGNRINRDTIKVYCTGDLIDGSINRQGDLLNLEFAPEWFDAVCLGNHEMAFIGSDKFSGKRRHDRKTTEMLLRLIDEGVFVPSILVPAGKYGDLLATHAGFSDYFGFDNPYDAHEYIKVLWEVAPALDEEIAVFDWQGSARAYGYGDPTGGIFELDWSEDRNGNFNQISGHTILANGPAHKVFQDGGIHWNIDVGAKHGKGIGALLVDEETAKVEPIFWGDRYGVSTITYYSGGEHFKKKEEEAKFPGWHEVEAGVWKRDTQLALETHDGSYIPYKVKPPETKFKVIDGANGEPKVQIATSTESKDYTHTSFKTVPLTQLDDLDIQIIDDPVILGAYREEVGRGFPKKLHNLLH